VGWEEDWRIANGLNSLNGLNHLNGGFDIFHFFSSSILINPSSINDVLLPNKCHAIWFYKIYTDEAPVYSLQDIVYNKNAVMIAYHLNGGLTNFHLIFLFLLKIFFLICIRHE
jgi:hypothetical protein